MTRGGLWRVIDSAYRRGQTRHNDGVDHCVIVGGEQVLCLAQDEEGVGDSSGVLLEQGGEVQRVIPAHAHHQMGGVWRQETKLPDDVGDSVPVHGEERATPVPRQFLPKLLGNVRAAVNIGLVVEN